MAVKLNWSAFKHAKELVGKGKVMVDERDAWSEHQPSAQEENEFIDAHGFTASMGSGIWESTTKNPKIPRNITNSLMEISKRCTAVRCFPRRAAQDNTSTLILSVRPHICMA